ncbi:hypothetical protein TIFTF001_014212 [Ficus carica]|uniref:Uncharacterized protein n=1 Tax=Ficus carica TaxID=3494 RepID=A0AA88D3T7_FICCA|nr:hypothetical protein TIFTF001_014212 [Ficus carica]
MATFVRWARGRVERRICKYCVVGEIGDATGWWGNDELRWGCNKVPARWRLARVAVVVVNNGLGVDY